MISSRVEDIDPSFPGEAVVGSSFSSDRSVAIDVSMAGVVDSSGGIGVIDSSTPVSDAGRCSVDDEDENHSPILVPIEEMSEGSVVSGCESVEPAGVEKSFKSAPPTVDSSRILDGVVDSMMSALLASSGACVEESSVIIGVWPSADSAVASGGCSVEEDDEENHSLIFEPIDEIREGSVVSGCDSVESAGVVESTNPAPVSATVDSSLILEGGVDSMVKLCIVLPYSLLSGEVVIRVGRVNSKIE